MRGKCLRSEVGVPVFSGNSNSVVKLGKIYYSEKKFIKVKKEVVTEFSVVFEGIWDFSLWEFTEVSELILGELESLALNDGFVDVLRREVSAAGGSGEISQLRCSHDSRNDAFDFAEHLESYAIFSGKGSL